MSLSDPQKSLAKKAWLEMVYEVNLSLQSTIVNKAQNYKAYLIRKGLVKEDSVEITKLNNFFDKLATLEKEFHRRYALAALSYFTHVNDVIPDTDLVSGLEDDFYIIECANSYIDKGLSNTITTLKYNKRKIYDRLIKESQHLGVIAKKSKIINLTESRFLNKAFYYWRSGYALDDKDLSKYGVIMNKILDTLGDYSCDLNSCNSCSVAHHFIQNYDSN